MQKNAPMPIFNHRKRPRQAVYADIQNVIPEPGQLACTNNYSDLMPVNGFPGKGNSVLQHEQQQKCVKSTGNLQPLASYSYNSTSMPNANKAKKQQSSFGQFSGQQTRGYIGVSASTHYPTNSQEYYNANLSRPGSDTHNQGHQYANKNSGNKYNYNHNISTQNNPSQFHQNMPVTRVGNRQPTNMNYVRVRPSGDGYTAPNSIPVPWQATAKNQPKKPGASMTNINQKQLCAVSASSSGSDQYVHSRGDGPVPSTPVKEATLKTGTSVKKNLPEKPVVFPTLHVVTTDIPGLKHWSKFKQNIPMLFEIFGILDSGIRSNTQESKVFQIRDESAGSINCIFHEIDRPMPKLTRGFWHRCMGVWNERLSSFHVLSIRPTSEQEKQYAKLKKKASERCLIQVTKNVVEQ